MEYYLGQLLCVGFNFAPKGWATCEGQLLPISQYAPLFALLGTTYGGDGHTTFALPDLRGRAPIHQGQGPGLANATLGQTTTTLSATEASSADNNTNTLGMTWIIAISGGYFPTQD